MVADKDIFKKLDEGRQYRDICISNMELRADGDGDSKKVHGYATKFNTKYMLWGYSDYEVWEQIAPHAFDECDMSDVIMQYNHEGRVFARNSNGTLDLDIDGVGLAIDAELGGTTLGQQVYEEIAGGYTTKMSFGFTVGKDERVTEEDHETGKIVVTRTITKISKLYDVSAVSLPANDATSISARSYSEGVIAELIEEVEKRKTLKQKLKILTQV